MEKKEVQDKIIKTINNKVSEEEFSNILKAVAPGTNLRAALDGILKAKKGALIVIENENTPSLIEGGFKINTKFTPQKLIELSKMDGAIVLSRDMKKIDYANVLVTTESKIKSSETGTRHKAAERAAKQAGTLIIAISERRQEISIFYKNIKYPLVSTEDLLRKTNEHMQLLEKQREIFDRNIEKLNNLEIRNYPSLSHAIHVMQRGLLIEKIAGELNKYLIELGREGMLLKIRLKEITKGIEKETDLVIKDYTLLGLKRSKQLLESLMYDEIFDNEHILEVLGYEKNAPAAVSIKGWRLLSKTSLHESEIAMLINESDSLGKALHSHVDFYKQIFGNDKANILMEEMKKIKLNNLGV